MSKKLFDSAWWEIRDDEDEDGPVPYWYGYCEGDKDGDRMSDGQPLVMCPEHFPIGTRVTMQEPKDAAFYDRLWTENLAKNDVVAEAQSTAARLVAENSRLAQEVQRLTRERDYCRTQWEVLEGARLMDRQGLSLDTALHAGERQVAERIAKWRAANGITPPAVEPAPEDKP